MWVLFHHNRQAVLHPLWHICPVSCGVVSSAHTLGHGANTAHPIACQIPSCSPGAHLGAALHPVTPLCAVAMLGTTTEPLPVGGCASNVATPSPSCPNPASLAWRRLLPLLCNLCISGFFFVLSLVYTRYAPLKPAHTSRFLATPHTTAVPSLPTPAGRTCRPVQCFPLLALALVPNVASSPCLLAEFPQGLAPRVPLVGSPTCSLLAHRCGFLCPPPLAPTTLPLCCSPQAPDSRFQLPSLMSHKNPCVLSPMWAMTPTTEAAMALHLLPVRATLLAGLGMVHCRTYRRLGGGPSA